MPNHKRKGLLAQRRRHDDEGEEDGSTAGDLVDYASTAGSLSTYAEDDGDASHVSNDDAVVTSARSPVPAKPGPVSKSAQAFRTTTDTEAMMNGLKIAEADDADVLDFDEADLGSTAQSTASKRPQPSRTRSQPTESVKQRSNGQNLRSAGQNRYFLHDDRHQNQVAQPSMRGRGRGFGPQHGRGGCVHSINISLGFANINSMSQQPAHDAAKQWTHDLHETVNHPSPQPQASTQSTLPHGPAHSKQMEAPAHGPNRSFSTTTVLGNVPISISLPGFEKKTKVMVKKHYTLLPQHRPPLRRDKPVRISIPDEHPRYIFPSTERSFIFIPRAMRPNQQFRARGRGSFHGSRRPSFLSYTPSVGMSRRPSNTASNSGSGMHTPTGPLPYQANMPVQRPVVRMPGNMNVFVPTAQQTEVFMGDNSAIIHSPSATLPMHQPIPQKTVSIADIESPTRGPPQQSQQPFHQQMPQVSDQSKMPHIPEGAIYAQPFQPFPNVFQPQFYSHPFQPGMAMHPEYSSGLGGPVMSVQQSQQTGTDQHQAHMPLAHETNGMVYYYDPTQQFVPSSMLQPTYYYPPMQNQMFYQ